MKNFWSALSGIAAIIGIVATIWIYKDSQRGQLKAIKISNYGAIDLLASYPKFPKEILSVSYDGKSINNYHVFSFNLENSGQTPIKKQDHDEPLNINFKGVSKIVSAERRSSYPSDIPIQFQIKDNTVAISPSLLNPADVIFIDIGIISQEGSKPEVYNVTGRIVGIKNIYYLSPEETSKNTFSNYIRQQQYKNILVISVILLLSLLLVLSHLDKILKHFEDGYRSLKKMK